MSTITEIQCLQVPPRWFFTKISTDDGLVGWGEAIVPKRKLAVMGAIEDFKRGLIGQDARRIEDLVQNMRKGAFFRRGPVLATAAASIEIALWDLAGKRADLGVHALFGGPVRDKIRTYCWIGGDRPADVVAHAKERIDLGFSAIKMNATASVPMVAGSAAIDELVERLGALRDAYGKTLDIALDLHGRVPRAVLKQLVREVEPFGLLWIEEPFLPEAIGTEEMLARICPHIPVASGERLLDRWDFRQMMQRGGVDILQPDVSITGLSELQKIASMAEAFDLVVAPHCPNGPVCLAASLQVGFCCHNVPIQEQSLGLHYNQAYTGLKPAEMGDYLTDPNQLTQKEGFLTCPDGPGLGVAIDGAKVEAASTDWTMKDAGWRHEDGAWAEW